MPYLFTWSAKDPSGQKVVREIEAETREQAKSSLLAEGFTELQLEEDEIGSTVRAGFPDKIDFLDGQIEVTAEERLKERDNPNPAVTVWGFLLQGLAQSKFLILLVVVLEAYDIFFKHYVSAILLAMGLCLWLAFLVCVSLPSVYYKKLIEAADWQRWDEVLSLVNMLKMIGRISVVKVPATELTRNRAKAFAGIGRLEDGLAEYRQCEGRPDCPTWLYNSFVAGLYTIAKQYDRAIEYNLMAIKEKPRSTAWWDLANRYARYKLDPAKAREAITEAEKTRDTETASTNLVKPLHARCCGVIAYLENDYATARTELENAIEMTVNVKWRPFNDGHLAISRAYLCCVLAKQRDFAGAKKNFDLAQKYLVATKEDELIVECRRLICEMQG